MGPIENCEFFENYENYESGEYWQIRQRDPMKITKTVNIRKSTKTGLQYARGTQRELRILRKLRDLRLLLKIAKISEGLNENYYKKSLRHEECLGRCQRGPKRTANFSRDPIRITKTAKYANIPRKPQTCQRVPTRTASFMKITRFTKIANIREDL